MFYLIHMPGSTYNPSKEDTDMTPLELKEALRAEEKLAQELIEYAGQWVAVRDHTVVSSADSLGDLLSHVSPEGLDRVLEVSKDPDAGCFF